MLLINAKNVQNNEVRNKVIRICDRLPVGYSLYTLVNSLLHLVFVNSFSRSFKIIYDCVCITCVLNFVSKFSQ